MIFAVKPTSSIVPLFAFQEQIEGDANVTDAVIQYGAEFEIETAVSNYYVASWTDPNGADVEIENLTPAICDVTNWPSVDRVTTGQAKIKASLNGAARIYYLGFDDLEDDALIPSQFVADTFGAFSWGVIKPLLDASGKSNAIFSGANYNANCWASDFDFSGIAREGKAGTLITPQHMWCAWHYRKAVGDVVTFASKSSPGTIITRTVIGVNQDSGPASTIPLLTASNVLIRDKQICVLDSPVPSSITHYPVVGEYAFLEEGPINETQIARHYRLVGIAVDQNRNAYLNAFCDPAYQISGDFPSTDVYGETFSGVPSGCPIKPTGPPNGFLHPYADSYHYAIGGDSGCPLFIPISADELALYTIYTSPTHGEFPHEEIMNLCIVSANDHAVSLGHTRPTDYTVTVAPDPTA